jgi:chromosomal replication initiation ATPase DnaA
LLLLGPKLSGKTYLSKIWENLKLPSSFVPDSANSPLSKPINTYKLICEDIDLLGPGQEQELLHIINSSNEEGKYLLLTATNFPKYNLKDLSSRVNSLNTVKIYPPDDELLKILIFKLFSDNSVKASNDIVKYLVKVLPRDFFAIKNAILHINKAALIQRRKVTIPFIKTIEDELKTVLDL